jgi:hypothetical protein
VKEEAIHYTNENELSEEFTAPRKHLFFTARTLLVLLTSIFAVVLLLALSIYNIYFSRSEVPKNANTHLCGNSTVEALALGCTFDQLMWSWYPPGCPHYANDEFMNAEPENPWVYYVDPVKKIPLPEENWTKALDGEIPLWGEKREHSTHCVYMFLSLAQILQDRNARYVPRLVDYVHLEHCAGLILGELRKDPHRFEPGTVVPKVYFDQTC